MHEFFLVNSTLICRLKLCDVRMSEAELDLILKDRDCLAEDLSIVKHTLKRILDGHADGSITDGPYAEVKEIIGGFIVVSSDSIEGAIKLAEGCPALQNGGKVEVRDIMNFEGM